MIRNGDRPPGGPWEWLGGKAGSIFCIFQRSWKAENFPTPPIPIDPRGFSLSLRAGNEINRVCVSFMINHMAYSQQKELRWLQHNTSSNEEFLQRDQGDECEGTSCAREANALFRLPKEKAIQRGIENCLAKYTQMNSINPLNHSSFIEMIVCVLVAFSGK
ncbi:uncharacterized protein LOC131146910 [Malania oleifera]|uniref:uncharacterized protein LOC131146910 n=1 Tax=Malania oleifera TaxID=397392 RepID=UPI0025AE88A2|nr:uncharacterized protein LOC131146910 [Malania oleifera]XP_057952738.1 uncharacterized protein LOC131146910 [Malania oleifera]